MSALARKAIEVRVIAELRLAPDQCTITLAELRRRVAAELGACSPGELAGAVQALRYSGKIKWGALALADSMKIETAGAIISAAPALEGPAAETSNAAGPDDEDDEDYPGGVNDAAGERPLPEIAPERAAAGAGGFVPSKLLHKAGVHAASTRAAARPLPVPQHESEVARAVREEVEDLRDRRRRARSTGTVRQPIALRRLGIPDLTLGEGVASLLVENAHDLMAAINRKHPQLWRRVILLAREREERPAEALYAALERGLEELEAGQPPVTANAA